ncbi:MAG: hypothetical protein JNL47_10155 [Bacteroidia bacterium]|nr:hypothetical protein [Bacteroidia bacterium]
MHKTHIQVILFFILFSCCAGNKIPVPASSETEKIILETSRSSSLKGNFFAFNTANLFTFFNSDEASFLNTVHALNPQMLRFPGGTIANFYHPSGKGYGFRKSDVKTREGGIDTNINNLLADQDAMKDTGNFLKRFIPFAKNLNTKIIYVANILTGEISETIQALEIIQSSGLTVEYVELGNEFYLNAYKDLVPDASEYVKKARPFAQAIRQKFPQLKLSVPAEAKPHKAVNKASGWDLMLSKFNFYDAVSIHIYPDFKLCSSPNKSANFDCYSNGVNQFIFQLYPDYLKRTSKLYQNKPLLITEWNIARPNRIFGNTMLHGIYTALFLLENMQLNLINPAVQLMCFHNLASKENAFSLLTPADLNESFPPSVNYAVFKMLAPIADKPELVPVKTSLPDNHKIKVYAFRVSGKYHLYIMNYGATKFNFKGFSNENGNVPEITYAECLYGEGKEKKGASLESYRYKADADAVNCPPYSFTHVTLKF